MEERPEGLLFLTTRGTPWTRFSVRCRFQRLQVKLGKRFRHYDFRRAWITRKIISGVIRTSSPNQQFPAMLNPREIMGCAE